MVRTKGVLSKDFGEPGSGRQTDSAVGDWDGFTIQIYNDEDADGCEKDVPGSFS